MAVDQMDVVDFVSTAENGDCHLTISDHLEWEGNDDHMLILQDKLNRYLAFIESGELVEKFPDVAGKRIIIDVRFMHAPTNLGFEFLSRIGKSIDEAGYGFEYKMLRKMIN